MTKKVPKLIGMNIDVFKKLIEDDEIIIRPTRLLPVSTRNSVVEEQQTSVFIISNEINKRV